jgi:hypothetical protein
MSIIVSLTVPDAVILGVDSAASLAGARKELEGLALGLPENIMQWAKGPLMKVYGGADKLFALGERPVGVATYGTPMIADRWLGSYLHEFVIKDPNGVLSRETTLQEIAEALSAFFVSIYETVVKPFVQDFRKITFDQIPEDERPGFGFVIGGYSANTYWPEVLHLFVPTVVKPQVMRKQRELNANWFGIYEPLERYFKGYSQTLLNSLLEQFEKIHGSALSEQEKSDIYGVLAKHEYPTTASLMPVSVGVEYVRFLLELVTNHYRFDVGISAVAAPIRIGTATYASNKFEILK